MTDRAEQLWQLEFDDLERTHGVRSVTWEQFDAFMQQSYGSLLPAHEARDRYDALRQTGTVSDFVREMRQSVHELKGTPLHSGGSVIVDFMSKLKPEVRRFVIDNAPVGWWSDVKDLHEKALTVELNRRIEPSEKPHESPMCMLQGLSDRLKGTTMGTRARKSMGFSSCIRLSSKFVRM